MPADTLSRDEIDRWLREGATVERHIVAAVTYERGYEEAADPIHRVGIASRYWDFDDAASADRMRRLIEELATRLASAKAEGVREGIEMAVGVIKARVNELQKLARETPYRAVRLERLAQATQASNLATAIRHISPPPAEPTGMTADGWIEWKGGECPVEPDAVVEVRMRDGRTATFDDGAVDEFWWGNDGCSVDILAYRIVKPAEPSAPVAEGE